jgi:hypothetical protein
MPIATVRQLCTPSTVVTSDGLVEQVAQIEDLATGKVLGRDFFRRNEFTEGLERLVKRGFDRLSGKSEDGAFYLTQAMGGGKTHSLIAFGLLASDPGLRREIVPGIASGKEFAAAKIVVFNGHQNPGTLLWGYIADQLGQAEVMAPFWRNGAKTPGITTSGLISWGLSRCSSCSTNFRAISRWHRESRSVRQRSETSQSAALSDYLMRCRVAPELVLSSRI